jgi:hypothetical protein
MTSSIPPPQVLSADFFRLYDNLARVAASKPSSQYTWKQVKAQRDKVVHDRAILANEVVRNLAFTKEQEERIELVSTHWFYGTTALQPQLWFRGGCPGKIDRAKKKLQDCKEELPKLMAALENIDTNILPPIEAQEQTSHEELQIAIKAEKEWKAMRDHVVEQYPSARLLKLQEEAKSIRRKLAMSEKESQRMKLVVSHFSEANSKYRDALRSMREAENHQKEHLKLKQRLESEENETFRQWTERDMEKEVERSEQSLEDAKRCAHKGDLLFCQAVASIPIPVRQRYMDLCLSFQSRRFDPGIRLGSTYRGVDISFQAPILSNAFASGIRSSSCGCSSSVRMADSIRRELGELQNGADWIECQLATAIQLAANVHRETTSIQQELRYNQESIDQEKDAILDDLRSRVHDGAAAQPSAPSDLFDDGEPSSVGRAKEHDHDAARVPMATAFPIH